MPATAKPLFYAPGIPMPKVPKFDAVSAKAVILDRDGALLMQRKRGRLGFFGGNASPGESILTALQRELWEEIEARISFDEVHHLTHAVRPSPEGRKLTIYMFWQNTGRILTQCHEHKMERFASYDELMQRRRFQARVRDVLQLTYRKGHLAAPQLPTIVWPEAKALRAG